ncbi:MAG TPA: outer membrane beta-barrel protein [Holophagaceae bacterium]|nr:outer membrane beta-barrel protein [Holophagaceae bacterium]
MKKLLASTLLALAATGLSAQSVDLNGGVSVGGALPVGDLYNKDSYGTNAFFGVQVGGHLDINLTSHHQIRAHLDYLYMPGSRWGSGWKNDYRTLQAGADWVYNFQSPDAGWYTIAGASINDNKVSYDNDALGISGDASQSGNLGLRGGAGYSFNRNFSLEGTLNQVFVDKNGADGFGFDTATWIGVSAVFRFK